MVELMQAQAPAPAHAGPVGDVGARHRPVAAGAVVTTVVVLVVGAFTAGWRSRGGLYRLTGY